MRFRRGAMATSIVQYKLPPSIGRLECGDHFRKIAGGFSEARGLRKQFIWNENGAAGGVYQRETVEDGKRFYQAPWLNGFRQRYGQYPEVEYFNTLVVAEN